MNDLNEVCSLFQVGPEDTVYLKKENILKYGISENYGQSAYKANTRGEIISESMVMVKVKHLLEIIFFNYCIIHSRRV
jgi:hypothetical protein